MARAFAWPSAALLMDEPYQSLDIPLRISLMDMSLSLMREEKRFLVTATHDPREAVYMGGRIIVLGKPGDGVFFDKPVNLPGGNRAYGSPAAVELEKELIRVLRDLQPA
jgi:NitT/TauT family transport system ATP-binding protein